MSVVELLQKNKGLAAGLAVIVATLIATGALTLTTPEAQQCQVDLGKAQTRIELLEEAAGRCETALDQLFHPAPSQETP